MRAIRAIGLASILAAVIVALIATYWLTRSGAQARVTQSAARRAFQRGDYAAALADCQELLKEKGDSPGLLIMAGEAASRLGQFEESLKLYDRVSDNLPSAATTARWAAGEVLIQIGRMTPAIGMMEKSLELDAHNDRARDRLIFLLNLAGRRWEAAAHLFEFVRRDRWSVRHLLYLGNTAKSVENEQELQRFLSASPADRMPLLGLARIRLRAGAHADARRLLSQVLEQFPDLVEAHVQLGKLWLQVDEQQLPAWNRALPKQADTHPDIWQVRGEWARDHQQPEAAARCFAEAVRLDPDHLAALNALMQVLNGLGRSAQIHAIAQRTARLDKFLLAVEHVMANEWSVRQAVSQQPSSGALEQFLRSKEHLEPILTAAQLTLELDRIWESVAWSRYGLSFDSSHVQLREIANKARPLLDPLSPKVRADHHVVDASWINAFPLPNWDAPVSNAGNVTANRTRDVTPGATSPNAPEAMALSASSAHGLKFVELPNTFDFSYFASRNSFEDGRRMFEMTGGGIGILDYDQDGWPDVFLAQGSSWPSDGSDLVHSDRLKRNCGAFGQPANAFEDITELARVEDRAFGQGVAIGDVDCDGFDDIYVCNVGHNQLWINQGDGTFRDGSAMIGSKSESWTVSAAIADLNGDGMAEIYDANYVEGEDVYTRRCMFAGLPRACSPLNFRRAKGRLLAVDETGIFQDVSSQVIDPSIQEGNALGVVVLRVKNQQLPSIFVANDQVANLMLTAMPDQKSPLGIRFEDQAPLNGLAFDGEGKAQACMGIAAGDVDQNGTLDLVVTNYHDEPNTLYLQQAGGLFRDATKSSGLVAPSLKMLGFGTQCIDSQSDGLLDLLVLNGHIDDMSHKGIPFRMRAQFFSGDGRARFVERRASEVGAFFEPDRLGRALALIDFDRDGRQDFIATDLERPTCLIRNECESGKFLTLTLVGTQSHRDAIGTEVVATVAQQNWTQQLTAGCGYMVSNQKTLHFGLGSASKVDRLDIIWPSGIRQSHIDVPVNSRWLAIENQTRLTAMP